MLLYAVFILLHFILLGQIKDRISRFAIWSYFLVWSASIILSQFGLYGLNIPDNRTITYVSIHLISFYLGYILIGRDYVKNYLHYEQIELSLDNSVKTILSNKIFWALFAILFLYVTSLYAKMRAFLMVTQSLGEVRTAFYQEDFYGPYFYYINLLVLTPISCILLFLWGYMTIKKRNIPWILIGLYLLMFFSLGGGRLGYFKIFMGVVFVWQFLFYGRNLFKQLFSRRFLFLASLTVALYFLIVYTTSARMGNVSAANSFEEDYVEQTNTQLVSYFVGPLVAFDYALNDDYTSKIGGYKYGALTFASVEELLYIGVLRLDRQYHRPIEKYVDQTQNNYVWIGKQTTWNALYTWCLYFYCDFGIVGLILFPFIFGLMFRKLIFYCCRRPNMYSISLLCFFYVDIILSVMKYSWQSFTILLMILLYIYMSNRSKTKTSIVRNKV